MIVKDPMVGFVMDTKGSLKKDHLTDRASDKVNTFRTCLTSVCRK